MWPAWCKKSLRTVLQVLLIMVLHGFAFFLSWMGWLWSSRIGQKAASTQGIRSNYFAIPETQIQQLLWMDLVP